jgi:serine phosphatase RsbU (regulator of sigma subunit)
MASAANTLQESLLPARLPDIADLRLLSAYRAVTAGSSVGGDWFDCLRVSDREVALVIGDVMGKGFRAAAAMGQVRTALRAAAAYDPSPAAVLTSLDSGVLELEDDEIVTLAYALLDLDTGRLGVARAGHPPPLIGRADGSVEVVEEGGSPPIGWRDVPRTEAWTTLERGSALVLYTDGLVESRRRSLDDGITELGDAVAGLHRGSGVDPSGWARWLDAIQARDDWQDDVAVLIALYLER